MNIKNEMVLLSIKAQKMPLLYFLCTATIQPVPMHIPAISVVTANMTCRPESPNKPMMPLNSSVLAIMYKAFAKAFP
jgi:hypothetical protein